MIEVKLETVQVSLLTPHRIVVLKAKTEERYLPIWIGPCEAEAISLGAKGVDVPRPLTHDLITNVLQVLDAQLLHILISDLTGNTFYAKLVLSTGGVTVEVDARPSDAIAVAARLGVPIYVAEPVMDEAGVAPEENILAASDAGDGEGLGVFRDFLNSLDIDSSQDS